MKIYRISIHFYTHFSYNYYIIEEKKEKKCRNGNRGKL